MPRGAPPEAQPDASAEAGADPAAESRASSQPPPPARSRAAAYLDLWERHLVQVASEGPRAPHPGGRKR